MSCKDGKSPRLVVELEGPVQLKTRSIRGAYQNSHRHASHYRENRCIDYSIFQLHMSFEEMQIMVEQLLRLSSRMFCGYIHTTSKGIIEQTRESINYNEIVLNVRANK